MGFIIVDLLEAAVAVGLIVDQEVVEFVDLDLDLDLVKSESRGFEATGRFWATTFDRLL